MKSIPLTKSWLEAVVMDILSHAASYAPQAAPGFENALRSCIEIQFHNPKTQDWFEVELTELINRYHTDKKMRWGDLVTPLIVPGACRQIPAHEKPAYKALWLKVIAMPEYASHAVQALSEMPEDIINYLGLWHKCQPLNWEKDLESFINYIGESCDPDQVIQHLRHEGGRWDQELRHSVNAIWKKNGHSTVPFRPSTEDQGPVSP